MSTEYRTVEEYTKLHAIQNHISETEAGKRSAVKNFKEYKENQDDNMDSSEGTITKNTFGC